MKTATEIFIAAGWLPHPAFDSADDPSLGYESGTLVYGVQPDGFAIHVKDWAKIPPGHPLYSADTPDTPEEAAQWLVDRYNAEQHLVDIEEGELEAEPHENNSPASAPKEPQPDSVAPDMGDDDPATEPAEEPIDQRAGAVVEDVLAEKTADGAGALMVFERDAELAEFAITDAEFDPALLELAAPEPAVVEGADYAPPQIGENLKDFAPDDFPPPEPPHEAGAFIFGDNLHQMRTAAIGLVVQAALERMPGAIDYERLSSLRNFTMGVSEGRWPDDPALREDLDTLEGTERLRRAIESERDAKVATLLEATREEIEVFDVGAGWP